MRRSVKADQPTGEIGGWTTEAAGSQGIPLTTERGRILDEDLNAKLIPPLRKASSPKNADWRKWYRYH